MKLWGGEEEGQAKRQDRGALNELSTFAWECFVEDPSHRNRNPEQN